MAQTRQAGTGPILQSKQLCQISFSLENQCVTSSSLTD
jgi:hypothetical protein